MSSRRREGRAVSSLIEPSCWRFPVAAQEAYEERQLMADAKSSVPQPMTLAGHEWLEYTVTATVEKKAMTFLNYTYSGPEGTFTIIGQIG